MNLPAKPAKGRAPPRVASAPAHMHKAAASDMKHAESEPDIPAAVNAVATKTVKGRAKTAGAKKPAASSKKKDEEEDTSPPLKSSNGKEQRYRDEKSLKVGSLSCLSLLCSFSLY